MDLQLPDQTEQLSHELGRWSAKRAERLGEFDGFDLGDWKELVEFGLPGITAAGGSDVDLVAAIMAAAQAGLPGPTVEAELALESGSPEAAAAIERGQVVTSVAPGPAGPVLAAWGAVADLVVDQGSGAVLARGPLPRAQVRYPMPHGWVERPASSGNDHLAPRRWLLASAALAGLGAGALERTTGHARERNQFNRPLASFQAVQFRLAECLNLLRGVRLGVLDAAWRAANGRPDADMAAALTWLWADRAADQVIEHTHQVYGALGFCNEAGLVQLTSQMTWLKLSIGRREVIRLVMGRRKRAPGDPPSRVMTGFVSTS